MCLSPWMLYIDARTSPHAVRVFSSCGRRLLRCRWIRVFAASLFSPVLHVVALFFTPFKASIPTVCSAVFFTSLHDRCTALVRCGLNQKRVLELFVCAVVFVRACVRAFICRCRVRLRASAISCHTCCLCWYVHVHVRVGFHVGMST